MLVFPPTAKNENISLYFWSFSTFYIFLHSLLDILQLMHFISCYSVDRKHQEDCESKLIITLTDRINYIFSEETPGNRSTFSIVTLPGDIPKVIVTVNPRGSWCPMVSEIKTIPPILPPILKVVDNMQFLFILSNIRLTRLFLCFCVPDCTLQQLC